MSDYNVNELVDAYKKIGIEKNDIVYVTGDILKLGRCRFRNRQEFLDSHYKALKDAVGEQGTIVFPTHTFSLCNSDNYFDLAKSPSESGALTEYMRLLPDAIRKFHPYSSTAAIGPFASKICNSKSKHVYDAESPFKYLVENKAKFISIGQHPKHNCSNVHYAEASMLVPYRYTKEFNAKVIIDNQKKIESFYMYVTYKGLKLERDRNEKIFSNFLENNAIHSTKVGIGNIYSYNMFEFHQSTCRLLAEDIYAWLKNEPQHKPYKD